jgi:hypothetical protein
MLWRFRTLLTIALDKSSVIVGDTEDVLQCVFLSEPIKDANRRTSALGLQFRFEVFE